MKKYKLVEIPPFEIINGEKVYNIGSDSASADPFVYGRLIRDGKFDEAEAMMDEKCYRLVEEEEDEPEQNPEQ